jgi:peptidyl-tRNA hydrolase, PTH2 family
MADKAPTSATALAVATGLLGLLVGCFLGQGSSIGLFSSSSSSNPKATKKSWPNSYDVKVHADSSDEEADDEDEDDEDEGDGKELNSFDDTAEEVKLILAVRTDLGMTKGTFSPSWSSSLQMLKNYQGKSQHNALMLRSRATNTSPAMHPQQDFSSGGK